MSRTFAPIRQSFHPTGPDPLLTTPPSPDLIWSRRRYPCLSKDPKQIRLARLNSQSWLAIWELCSVAVGMSEADIARDRVIDEKVLGGCEGVRNVLRIVWAVNGE